MGMRVSNARWALVQQPCSNAEGSHSESLLSFVMSIFAKGERSISKTGSNHEMD